MNEEMIRSKVHRAVDACGASLQDNPFLAQRIMAANRRKEGPHMKKLSTGMIIAIVLMLLSVTAVAVGLSIEQVWQQAFDKMGTWGEVWNIGEPTEEDLTMDEAAAIGRNVLKEKFGVTDAELDAMGFYPSYFEAEVDDGTYYPADWRFLWSSKTNTDIAKDDYDHGPNGEYRVYMDAITGEIETCIFYTTDFWRYAQRIWDVGNYDEVYRNYKQTDFFNQPDDVQEYWTKQLSEKGYAVRNEQESLHQALLSAQLELQFNPVSTFADNDDPQVAAAWATLEKERGLDAELMRKYAYVATVPGWNTGYDDVCIHYSYELEWERAEQGVYKSPCSQLVSRANSLGLFMVSFEKGTTNVAAMTHVTRSDYTIARHLVTEGGLLARTDWTAEDLVAFHTAYTELEKAFARMDAAGAVGVERAVVFDTARVALGVDPQYCTNIVPTYDVKQWFSDDAPKKSEFSPTMTREEVVAKYGEDVTFWPLEVRYDQHRQYHMTYSLPREGELTEAQALEIALEAIRERHGQKALDKLGEYDYGVTLERYMGEHGKEITFWVFMITNDRETFEHCWQVKFIGENYEDYGSRCFEIYEPNDPNFGNG